MTTTIPILRFSALVAESHLCPDDVWNRQIPAADCRVEETDTFLLGCRLHALTRRIADRDRLRRDERELLPWLTALRTELRAHGVSFIQPEVKLAANGALPRGVCDLLLTGGERSASGVAELKVVNVLPDVPRDRDVLQLARYEDLLASQTATGDLWGALVYASIPARQIRIFVYRDVTRLRRFARTALAA
jgi:hypothetical protein